MVNDFLPKNAYQEIRNLLFSTDFPWHFRSSCVFGDESEGNEQGVFQFVHRFYNDHSIYSDYYYPVVVPVLKHLGAMAVIRAKVNLQTRDCKNTETKMHTDFSMGNNRTAILYFDDSNGYTRFDKSNLKVKSEHNKLLDFPNELLHAGATQTDRKARVVLNINYFPTVSN